MNDKIALVTGATRGIGWAVAQRLAHDGFKVYISSTSKEIKKATATINEFNKNGMSISTVEYDAFDVTTFKPMIDCILENEHRIDVLVNNFGYTEVDKDLAIDKVDYCNFERIVNLNLRNVIIPIQLSLPSMQKNGGSIINISSIAANVPDMSELAYGTAKSGICHLTKMIAAQQAQYNIRCNAILPGIVATDAVKQFLTDDFKAFFLRHVPLGRMANPDEIAKAVSFMVSNDYVTGQLLEIAGGFGLPTPLYADLLSAASAKSE